MHPHDNREFTLEQANTSWNLLDSAIDKIYNREASILSYEELYRNAYYMVIYRYGDMAYSALEKSIEKNFIKYFNRLSQYQDDDLLKAMETTWIDVKLMLKMIKDIFLYMERNYINPKKLNPINIMGYDIFKRLLFEKRKDVYITLKDTIFNNIRKEREGYKIDRILIKNLVQMMVILGF